MTTFFVSDDKARLDVALIAQFLSEDSYWATGRSRETIERSIAHSHCFGVYQADDAQANRQQVGFARVITDYATFAYLADVFILPSYRGQGLSKQLMAAIMAHPQLQSLRRWLLVTADAHGLYAQFGFQPLPHPERVMGMLRD
jgi:GNAT superfamily N-acetyltransferase